MCHLTPDLRGFETSWSFSSVGNTNDMHDEYYKIGFQKVEQAIEKI